jgi:phosphatidylglycerophosphate synthase
MHSFALRHIPVGLTALRAALGPVVGAFAVLRPMPVAFAVCLVLALLSDYFDGVIARKLGVATPSLRRMDSIADSLFYLCAFFAAWRLHSGLLRPYLLPLALLVAIELARYVYDFRKFGKEASYHMWSSKLWGVALFVGFYAVLVYGHGGWPVSLAIYVGIAADVEGLAISVTLRKWRTDVPTLFHALNSRDGEA